MIRWKRWRLGLSASIMRDIVCRILRKRPEANNWSPGNIWREVEDHVYGCEWFKVYDLIEAFDKATGEQGDFKKDFPNAINDCFVEEGIGWQLVKGKLSPEGMRVMAVSRLRDTQRPTAAGHWISNRSRCRMRRSDVSQRPFGA
jgi:AbiJ N-terminal domain 4